jgi:type IV secretory pathway VirB4 component
MWCFDAFELYTRGLLTNANMLVAGEPGSGKSAAIKTYLYRTLSLYGTGGVRRWAAIVDPKREYVELAGKLGMSVLELYPGGPNHINPLDAGPGLGGLDRDELVRRRSELVRALLEVMLYRSLNGVEEGALSWTLDLLTRTPAGRVQSQPSLHDVFRVLGDPPAELRGHLEEAAGKVDFAVELRDVRLALDRMLHRDLRGIFDARDSTSAIDWNAKGIVIDLSQVFSNPLVLRLLMVGVTSWLTNLFASRQRDDSLRCYLVLDESWSIAGDLAVARWVQSVWRLCRDYGVSGISMVHRVSDFGSQADDGTAASKMSAAIVSLSQTKVLFRTSRADIAATRAMLGLSEKEAELVAMLARGRALWKVGDHSAVVQHKVAEAEWAFARTDARMVV